MDMHSHVNVSRVSLPIILPSATSQVTHPRPNPMWRGLQSIAAMLTEIWSKIIHRIRSTRTRPALPGLREVRLTSSQAKKLQDILNDPEVPAHSGYDLPTKGEVAANKGA